MTRWTLFKRAFFDPCSWIGMTLGLLVGAPFIWDQLFLLAFVFAGFLVVQLGAALVFAIQHYQPDEVIQ